LSVEGVNASDGRHVTVGFLAVGTRHWFEMIQLILVRNG